MEASYCYTPVGKLYDEEGIELVDYIALTKSSDAISSIHLPELKTKDANRLISLIILVALAAAICVILYSANSPRIRAGVITSDLCNINGDPHLCYCSPGIFGSGSVVYNNLWTRCYQGRVCHLSSRIDHVSLRVADSQSCYVTGGCYDSIAGVCYHTKLENLLSRVNCDGDATFEAFCPQQSYKGDGHHMCTYGKLCYEPEVGTNVTISGGCYDIFIGKCV